MHRRSRAAWAIAARSFRVESGSDFGRAFFGLALEHDRVVGRGVGEAARPRAEVVGEIEAQESRDAEARVLLDVGELVREQHAARGRTARNLASAPAREEDVASDDEGPGAKQPRGEMREGSRVEPRRIRQSDWRRVADDLRSVE